MSRAVLFAVFVSAVIASFSPAKVSAELCVKNDFTPMVAVLLCGTELITSSTLPDPEQNGWAVSIGQSICHPDPNAGTSSMPCRMRSTTFKEGQRFADCFTGPLLKAMERYFGTGIELLPGYIWDLDYVVSFGLDQLPAVYCEYRKGVVDREESSRLWEEFRQRVRRDIERREGGANQETVLKF